MAKGCPEAEEKIKDVIVAIATPPGSGAIAMLRLSGQGCSQLASNFLRWSRSVPQPRTATLAEARTQDGELLDRVIATVYPEGSSYTGEEMIEITTHGSHYILSSLLDCARKSGARLAEPGEFTQRAFLNGRMDLTQAEAVCALIRAKTRLAHRIAINHVEGGLSKHLSEIRAELLHCLADMEASLDHPEENIPQWDAGAMKNRLQEIQSRLSALARTHRTGKLWTEGARVAIVGSPNVGKSSLFNALLGHDRAIVTEIPGTTRDTLEESVDIDGLKIILTDTAGLHNGTDDRIEKMGMERSHQTIDGADLVLLILDRSRPLRQEERDLIREVRERCALGNKPVILVMNKSDIAHGRSGAPCSPSFLSPPSGREGAYDLTWQHRQILEVSARQGTGLDELRDAIARTLNNREDADEAGGILLTSLRHRQAVEQAQAAVEHAEGVVETCELAAVHLREALSALAVIVGETTTEDILHAVFSKFCIGK